MEETSWNKFVSTGNIMNYLEYKRELVISNEKIKVEAGVENDGPGNCGDRDNFICST